MDDDSPSSSTMAETDDPTTDPTSPYYIHPDSDNFASIFGSSPLRGNENYFTWKNNFLYALKLLNKTGFVDGTIEKPDESSPLYRPWKQNNALVKIWLMNAVSEELRMGVRIHGTARDAWEHLRGFFGQSVHLGTYLLRRRIGFLRQDGDSVSAYFGKLSEAWNELSAMEDEIHGCRCGGCECGIEEKIREDREKEKIYGFLMGLDDEFDGVRRGLLCGFPLPKTSQALGVVLLAEEAIAGARRSYGGDTAELRRRHGGGEMQPLRQKRAHQRSMLQGLRVSAATGPKAAEIRPRCGVVRRGAPASGGG